MKSSIRRAIPGSAGFRTGHQGRQGEPTHGGSYRRLDVSLDHLAFLDVVRAGIVYALRESGDRVFLRPVQTLWFASSLFCVGKGLPANGSRLPWWILLSSPGGTVEHLPGNWQKGIVPKQSLPCLTLAVEQERGETGGNNAGRVPLATRIQTGCFSCRFASHESDALYSGGFARCICTR